MSTLQVVGVESSMNLSIWSSCVLEMNCLPWIVKWVSLFTVAHVVLDNPPPPCFKLGQEQFSGTRNSGQALMCTLYP